MSLVAWELKLVHHVSLALLIHLNMKGVCVWQSKGQGQVKDKQRTSRGQAEEGCQRCNSSGAFQMLCKGCEFILLKSKTISLNTKQPQCQQDIFVYRAWEHTNTHTHINICSKTACSKGQNQQFTSCEKCIRHFQRGNTYATLYCIYTLVYIPAHDINLRTLKVTTPVHPAVPLFFAVLLCHSTLSGLLTIMLLPEQFPNVYSETTPLMQGLPPSTVGSGGRSGLPFYPVWPSANRVLFQMVCLMHTVDVRGWMFCTCPAPTYSNIEAHTRKMRLIFFVQIVLKFPRSHFE